MVRENETSYTAVTQNLDNVAMILGVRGLGERKRRIYQNQRDSHREFVNGVIERSNQENNAQ